MIESILVEDESSMLFSTGKLPEKQVFLCNRKFLGIPYYIKRHLRANDAHSREDVGCRKQPRSARACASHKLYFFDNFENVYRKINI